MSEIITSLEPGHYYTGQTVTITFPSETRRAIITQDDRSPVLTEIIAYDRGTIPPGTTVQDRPFIAVTQDGRGNVVYDGGFPKFYNSHIYTQNGNSWPSLPYASWNQLSPASRYMNNCINFCANPRKVLNGNRKILLMGNTYSTESYDVATSYRNSTSSNAPLSFRDTFEGIAQLGNWDLTIINLNDVSGSKLDFTYDYFDQFAAVIFMGAYAYSTVPTEAQFRVSERCAEELGIYRRNGNGVIIITDHANTNFNNIEEATTRAAVFAPDPNRIAKYFGAYFSGDVNRSPVSVGAIRLQLGEDGLPGDHVLLNGLSDNDYIFAGLSESLTKVQSFDADQVDPNTPWIVNLNTPGEYRINVMIQLDDGAIVTRSLLYEIINPSNINLVDNFGRIVTDSFQTFKPLVDYTLKTDGDNRTMSGRIYIDDVLKGFFIRDAIATRLIPLGTRDNSFVGMPQSDGQILKFSIKEPFEYVIQVKVNIPDPKPYWEASGSVSTFNDAITKHPYFEDIPIEGIYQDMTFFGSRWYMNAVSMGSPLNKYWWTQIGLSRLAFGDSILNPITAIIYQDVETWEANKPVIATTGDVAIIANTNQIYYWDDIPIVWQEHPNNAVEIFSLNRRVLNKLDNSNWIIQANSTVTN